MEPTSKDKEVKAARKARLKALMKVPLITRRLKFRPQFSDKEVTHGTLENGVQFFIQKWANPPKRMYLRLVVQVGSVQEEPGEFGFAHFIEHLAFRSTEHFPHNNEISAQMRALGVDFGADLNAVTSFDYTAYDLVLPISNDSAFTTDCKKGLQILSDWGGHVLFDKDIIEQERGVVLSEYFRTKQGAEGDATDANVAVARERRTFLDFYMHFGLQGTKYENRMPIGTEECLRGATAESLQNFYQKWYKSHPERMSVMVIGDITDEQVKQVQSLIESMFTATTAPSPAEDLVDMPALPPTFDRSASINIWQSREFQKHLNAKPQRPLGPKNPPNLLPLDATKPHVTMLVPTREAGEGDVMLVCVTFRSIDPPIPVFNSMKADAMDINQITTALVSLILSLRCSEEIKSKLGYEVTFEAQALERLNKNAFVSTIQFMVNSTQLAEAIEILWQEIDRLKRFPIPEHQLEQVTDVFSNLFNVPACGSVNLRKDLTDAILYHSEYSVKSYDITPEAVKVMMRRCTPEHLIRVARFMFAFQPAEAIAASKDGGVYGLGGGNLKGASHAVVILPGVGLRATEAEVDSTIAETWLKFCSQRVNYEAPTMWLPKAMQVPVQQETGSLVEFLEAIGAKEEDKRKGSIVGVEFDEDKETVTLKLSNGMVVNLKNTEHLTSASEDPYKDDLENMMGIVCTASAYGGLADEYVHDRKRLVAASMATYLAQEIGIGHLTRDIQKVLGFQFGIIVSKCEVELFEREIKMGSVTGECEGFDNLCTALTECFYDSSRGPTDTKPWGGQGFKDARKVLALLLSNKKYTDDLKMKLFPGMKGLFKPTSNVDRQAVEAADAEEFYNRMFGNPEEFTLSFVGSLPIQPSKAAGFLQGEEEPLEKAIALIGRDMVEVIEKSLATIQPSSLHGAYHAPLKLATDAFSINLRPRFRRWMYNLFWWVPGLQRAEAWWLRRTLSPLEYTRERQTQTISHLYSQSHFIKDNGLSFCLGESDVEGEQNPTTTTVYMCWPEWPQAQITPEGQQLIISILQHLLEHLLRESLGATYVLSLSPFSVCSDLASRLVLQFECDPLKCFLLVEEVINLLGNLSNPTPNVRRDLLKQLHIQKKIIETQRNSRLQTKENWTSASAYATTNAATNAITFKQCTPEVLCYLVRHMMDPENVPVLVYLCPPHHLRKSYHKNMQLYSELSPAAARLYTELTDDPDASPTAGAGSASIYSSRAQGACQGEALAKKIRAHKRYAPKAGALVGEGNQGDEGQNEEEAQFQGKKKTHKRGPRVPGTIFGVSADTFGALEAARLATGAAALLVAASYLYRKVAVKEL